MPKPPTDAAIRSAAMAAGFTTERAVTKGRWRLRRDDGTLVRNPETGTTAFTPEQLVAFTEARGDDLD